MDTSPLEIAVLIPCFNEEKTIAAVVNGFKASLPDATCYVFDNNSSDGTIQEAIAAGAVIQRVTLQGKGNVVRRMFADVEADIYVMVDGDATYDAGMAPELVNALLEQKLDMVVASRVTDDPDSYRSGHQFGNKLLTGFVSLIFGRTFKDMLSGYRVFSRRFAKSFPAHSNGFDIETEIAVHALELKMPVMEIRTRYGARPEGSYSKLNTYSDGFRILAMILRLFKTEKPLAFFFILSAFSFLVGGVLAFPLFITYLDTGLVPRLPTAVLSASLALLGFIFATCGVVLDSVTIGRKESRYFAYLATALRINK